MCHWSVVRRAIATCRSRGSVIVVIVAVAMACRLWSIAGVRLVALIGGGHYIDQGDVIRQQSRFDCGVAALEMILDHVGRPTNGLDSLRGVTRERSRGLSFAELERASAANGIAAWGWLLVPEDLHRIPLPAIAHFPDHYVVLDSLSPSGMVFLRDPASGRLRMTMDTFRRRWTRRTLIFTSDSSASQRATRPVSGGAQ